MSITTSNCNQICHSPTNTSKSKMLYTFSKEGRFPKRRVIMCDKFYDIGKLNTTRSTAFGYGDKYDFTKDVPKSPPANSYNIKSEFSEAQKRGFGFGCGRNQMEITGPFAITYRDKNPGPGTYQPKSLTDDVITYSLGRKYNEEDHEKLKVPGPGSYPVTFNINEKGNYFLSKYKNSCIRSFKGTIERANSPQNKVPGPGAYPTTKTDLSPDGRYFLSKIASNPVRSFGNSIRANIARKNDTPGPGNYKLPSQFGHYCSKNVLKKPKTQGAAINTNKLDKLQKQNIKE